jgi:hypothetical protein
LVRQVLSVVPQSELAHDLYVLHFLLSALSQAEPVTVSFPQTELLPVVTAPGTVQVWPYLQAFEQTDSQELAGSLTLELL